MLKFIQRPFSAQISIRQVMRVMTQVILLVSTLALAKPTETDPEILTRESMVAISKQLGVTCTYCHDTKNFRDGKMATFKVAKEHLRLTAYLNSNAGFNNHPKVDCAVCHRGEAKPPANFKDFSRRAEASSDAEKDMKPHESSAGRNLEPTAQTKTPEKSSEKSADTKP